MRRVKISVNRLVILAPPVAFRSFPEKHGAQIVNVRTFRVCEFSENTVSHHVQNKHFLVAVTAVFENHAMPLRQLRSIRQCPTFVHGNGGGNLDKNVFSRIHRTQRHRNVQIPRRRNDNDINILALAKIFPRIFRSRVNARRWKIRTNPRANPHRFFRTGKIAIGNGNHPRKRNVQNLAEQTPISAPLRKNARFLRRKTETALTEPDEPDAHRFTRLRCQIADKFRPRRTRTRFRNRIFSGRTFRGIRHLRQRAQKRRRGNNARAGKCKLF